MKIETFKVEEWFNEYEPKALYDLGITCVDSFSVNSLLDFVQIPLSQVGEIFDRKLDYGDIHGSLRLKKAIAGLYKNQKEKNITITHGAIGANQLAMLALVEPCDKIVSILPNYQQHYSIPKSLGGDVHCYYLREENNWLPDLEELSNLVGNDTKLICLSNPNNPTGSVIPDDMMGKIVDIARESGAYILCDEVYRGLNHEGNPFCASIADIYEKGISTGSMSKTFSLAGLRLGWVVANEDIMREINHQREYNTISMSILDDFFASVALENRDKIVARNINLIKTGKKILMEWADNENLINLVEPKGGTTAFARYDLETCSTDLCKQLQHDTGIMILPGETLEYDKYLRIGYANNFEQLEKALNIFSQWLKKIS